MRVEMRNIADIKPYPHNPRQNDHAVEAVAASTPRSGCVNASIRPVLHVAVAAHVPTARRRQLPTLLHPTEPPPETGRLPPLLPR
jgi:hypothetical protein